MIGFFGAPSNRDRQLFQTAIKEIIETNKWPDFFKHIEIKAPSPLDMTNRLTQAVRNSLKKRYHSKNMDFSAIHKSGVSKILLKGESYTCNTNLKRVYLEDVWGFPEGTLFLDATCLVYGFDNKRIFVIDWCHRDHAAIKHSGDQINYEKRQGTHTIHIELEKLDNNVKTLVFTISAYTATLKEIINPYILFNDPDTKQELCRYQFEEKDTGDKTAVIMAKLFRPKVGAPWQVVAIGNLGMGRASNYDPIEKDLEKFF